VVEVLEGRSLAGVTEFSITDLDDLLADLALTRDRSYSLDRQEAVLGRTAARRGQELKPQ
jgi:DNA-binding IclR family transcriptional regulator